MPRRPNGDPTERRRAGRPGEPRARGGAGDQNGQRKTLWRFQDRGRDKKSTGRVHRVDYCVAAAVQRRQRVLPHVSRAYTVLESDVSTGAEA